MPTSVTHASRAPGVGDVNISCRAGEHDLARADGTARLAARRASRSPSSSRRTARIAAFRPRPPRRLRVCAGSRRSAAFGCRRADRADRLQGRRPGAARDQRSGSASSGTRRGTPSRTSSARSTSSSGRSTSRALAVLLGRADRDRDRALPERARARRRARRRRLARRDARGDSERRARALGHPRARPGRPRPIRAVAERRASAGRRSSRPARSRVARCSRRSSCSTIMIIPITASISRDLFLQVPADIKEGAIGLGLTRWEMVRGVVLPYTRGGLISAVLLGARPRARRGDRRHAGDRNDRAPDRESVRHRRHAREPDRGAVSGRGVEPAGRLALLPRRDPARDLARRELLRAPASSVGTRSPRGPEWKPRSSPRSR